MNKEQCVDGSHGLLLPAEGAFAADYREFRVSAPLAVSVDGVGNAGFALAQSECCVSEVFSYCLGDCQFWLDGLFWV
jgi:hypothetical protein